MVLYARLPRRSILFGHSCFWTVTQFTVSAIWQPDFERTKTENVATQLVRLFHDKTRHIKLSRWQRQKIREIISLELNIRPKLILMVHFTFLLVNAIVSTEVQAAILATCGITRVEELSYKVLYYLPTVHKILFLFCTAFVTLRRQHDWLIYDRFTLFSVTLWQQTKYFLYCLISGTPGGLIAFFEMYICFTFLPEHRHNWVRLLHGHKFCEQSLSIQIIAGVPIVCNMLTYVIRYRPLLNVIYSSLCVRRHLHNLTNQLLLNEFGKGRVPAARATTREFEFNHQLASGDSKPKHSRKKSLFSLEKSVKISISSPWHHFEMGRAPNPPTPCTDISSIRQLESHLIFVGLFVEEMDQAMPLLVYSMCLLSLIQFIYTVLFTIKLEFTVINLSAGLALSIGRLTLPLALLLASSSMHRAAKRLLNELEFIFAQDSSSLLLHKQFSDSLPSWQRIFKLLSRIQFTCDNLLELSLSTMVKFLIYAASVIFIALQFDSLITERGAPSTTIQTLDVG